MIRNLLNLFFPNVCLACLVHLTDCEVYVCTTCRHDFPVTEYHFTNSDAVKNVLYGRVKLEEATALLEFSKKGIVQQLLHNLKYRGQEDVGVFLGQWLGGELKTIPKYAATIDVVIPVPLHKFKLRKRGYNQVDKFGKEIAKALNSEYNTSVLQKVTNTKTQVFKNRLTRTEPNDAVFELKDFNYLKGKHILLVDDIITTGATLESCANVLLQTEDLKISIATMAITI